MRAGSLLLWSSLVLGCTGDEPPGDRQRPPGTDATTGHTGTTGGTTPTADTGPIAPATTLEATCTPPEDGNVLRFLCQVTVDPPQPVEITFAPVDGSRPARTHVGTEAVAAHEVPLYFMLPKTDYTWTARATGDPASPEVSGVVTTGTLPEGARVDLEVEGVSSASMVGIVSPCLDGGYAVILASDGAGVLWYENLSAVASGFLETVAFTEDQTVLGMVDGGVTEVDLLGNRTLRLEPGTHLTDRVHHDLFKKAGRVFVLFQEPVDYGGHVHLLDGFFVFDETPKLLGEWHLADHYTPSSSANSPLPNDTSHANAIWVDDKDQALISFRHLSGVMAVDVDTDSPSFGTVAWTMVGDPDSDLPGDLALSSDVGDPVDFFKQHNPHFLPDGRLTMFDNRLSFAERSRILDLEVDPVASTARITAAYELPLHCDFQGGAQRTITGNPLGTCAPYRQAFEFDEGVPDAWVWSAQATCIGSSISVYTPRYIPLEW